MVAGGTNCATLTAGFRQPPRFGLARCSLEWFGASHWMLLLGVWIGLDLELSPFLWVNGTPPEHLQTTNPNHWVHTLEVCLRLSRDTHGSANGLGLPEAKLWVGFLPLWFGEFPGSQLGVVFGWVATQLFR